MYSVLSNVKSGLLTISRWLLPIAARRALVRYTRWPPVGLVRFGSLRRLKPISPYWGSERGQPIDRYYIESFLSGRSVDISGRVLEVGEDTYTRKFGGDQVTRCDVLHVVEQKSEVTIIGDLTRGDCIPADTFDCVILTQTLQVIYDVPAAIRTIYRILRPGGVALITVPGISKISRYDMDRWGYYWSFTTMSMRRLLERCFPGENLQIRAYGNVLASIAFLHGISADELRRKEIDYIDPDYELLITIRAKRPLAED